MINYKSKAVTIIQTLINATGAEFEGEELAIDIIADNLEKEVKEIGVTQCSSKKCNEPVYEFGMCHKHFCISELDVQIG